MIRNLKLRGEANSFNHWSRWINTTVSDFGVCGDHCAWCLLCHTGQIQPCISTTVPCAHISIWAAELCRRIHTSTNPGPFKECASCRPKQALVTTWKRLLFRSARSPAAIATVSSLPKLPSCHPRGTPNKRPPLFTPRGTHRPSGHARSPVLRHRPPASSSLPLLPLPPESVPLPRCLPLPALTRVLAQPRIPPLWCTFSPSLYLITIRINPILLHLK